MQCCKPYSGKTHGESHCRIHKCDLKTVETRSLSLTREVLDGRKHFGIIIQDLLLKVKTTMEEKLQQGMICEAQQILARLDEIALKPNPLYELDYIDLLIESEKKQCKPGHTKRLEYLQEARQSANLMYQLKEGGLEDAEQWLKDIITREAKKQYTHSFQHARGQTPLLPATHAKQTPLKGGKWWPFGK